MAKPPDKPVTPEVERLIAFVNTRPRGRWPERLADADERVLRLREALAVLADDEHGDAGAHERAWEAVNAVAAEVPTTVRFASADSAALRPAGDGTDAELGALLADLHAAVTAGHWGRMRVCAFAPCAAAFYDATRSRTQRWHSYEVCGNRANVASYRRRAAAGSRKRASR
jgi:predicted RNA-binding Zn ribbon-like protein